SSILISIYLLVLFEVLSIPLMAAGVAQEILPVIPWWLLVSFGSYSLWSLGWGVFTFRDCPEAYHELLQDLCANGRLSDMHEINEAKNDLRSRAVTVD
ncbi:dolichol-phosphate mannosyltransferase subunit 3, partial [Suillus lakei]